MNADYKKVSISFVRRSSFLVGVAALLPLAIAAGCGPPFSNASDDKSGGSSGAVAGVGHGTNQATQQGLSPSSDPASSSSAASSSSSASSQAASSASSGAVGSSSVAVVGSSSSVAVAALVLLSGNAQTGTSGSTLSAPLAVVAEDASGRPVAGAIVAFSVVTGGGTLSATSVTSDSSGQASSSLTLGPLEGTSSVTATAQGVAAAVTFTEVSQLAPAQHADYYVAQQAAGASDANDGRSPTVSAGHGPWLTVGHAASVGQAGDIVHVSTGNYAEDVSLSNVGTATAHIRFSAPIGLAVTVRSFHLRSAQYVELWGFNVVGPKTFPSNWLDMPQVVIDDSSVGWIDPTISWTGGRQTLVDQKYATYISTVNAFNGPNYSAFTGGIWISGSSNITVSNNTVQLHTIGIDCDNGSSHLTIAQNDTFHCRNGIWSYASSGATSFSSSTISGNHSHQNLYSGITASSSAQSITISGNLCEYNGIHQYEVSSGSSGCTVHGNVARYGGYYSETMQYPGSSAYNFYNVGPGNVADSNDAFYQVDASLNDGNGFIIDTSPNPVSFVNNVAYRNEGGGITFTGTSGNTAVNNTLVGNGYQSTTTGTNGAGIRVGSTSTGNTILNNIFSSNRGCCLFTGGTLTSQALVDYNLYDSGVPAVHNSYSSGAFYDTVSALRSATGCEMHGLSASPGFADVTVPNFNLTTTSAAIGAGDSNGAPALDLTGYARHAPPDIGAYEHR